MDHLEPRTTLTPSTSDGAGSDGVVDTAWVPTQEGRHLAGRKKTNTEPELILRRALSKQRPGYRLHRRIDRGCTPDLVYVRARVAVFVGGCWWHQCPKHGRKTPFTGPNAERWEQKFRRNKERDTRASQIASDAGYRVFRTWECDVRADPDFVADQIVRLADRR